MRIKIDGKCRIQTAKSEEPFFYSIYVPSQFTDENVIDFFELIPNPILCPMNHELILKLKTIKTLVPPSAYIGFEFFAKTPNTWGEMTSQPVGCCLIYLYNLYYIHEVLNGIYPWKNEDNNIDHNIKDNTITYRIPIKVPQDNDFQKGIIKLIFKPGDVVLEEKWNMKWTTTFSEREFKRKLNNFNRDMTFKYRQKIDTGKIRAIDDCLEMIHLPSIINNYAKVPSIIYLMNTNNVNMNENWMKNIVNIAMSRMNIDEDFIIKIFFRQLKNTHVFIKDFLKLGILLGRVVDLYVNILPYNDDFDNESLNKYKDDKIYIERMEQSINRMSLDCEDGAHGCIVIYNSLCEGDWKDTILIILKIIAKYFYSIFMVLSLVGKKAIRSNEEEEAAHIHTLIYPKCDVFNRITNIDEKVLSNYLNNRYIQLGKYIDKIMGVVSNDNNNNNNNKYEWKNIKIHRHRFCSFEKKLLTVLTDGTGLTDGKMSPICEYVDDYKSLENIYYDTFFGEILQDMMESVPSSVKRNSNNCFDVCKKIMRQKAFSNDEDPSRIYNYATTFLTTEFFFLNTIGFFLINDGYEYGVKYEKICKNNKDYYLETINYFEDDDIKVFKRLARTTNVPIKPVLPYNYVNVYNNLKHSLRRLCDDVTYQDMINTQNHARIMLNDMLTRINSIYNMKTDYNDSERTITISYIVNDVNIDEKWIKEFERSFEYVKNFSLVDVNYVEEQYCENMIGFRLNITWKPDTKMIHIYNSKQMSYLKKIRRNLS